MSLRRAVVPFGLALTFASLLLGAACSKTKAADKAAPGSGSGSVAPAPSGPSDPRSQAIIDKSKELRDRACACQDALCASAVRKDHDAWLHTQIDEMGKLGEPRSTKEQQEEAATYQRQLFECLDKLKTAPGAGNGSMMTPAPAGGAATGSGATP